MKELTGTNQTTLAPTLNRCVGGKQAFHSGEIIKLFPCIRIRITNHDGEVLYQCKCGSYLTGSSSFGRHFDPPSHSLTPSHSPSLRDRKPVMARKLAPVSFLCPAQQPSAPGKYSSLFLCPFLGHVSETEWRK